MPSEPCVIIGGGIVGLATAWFLRERGREVVVLSADPIDGSASTGNAGLIAIGHPPMPRPGLVRTGLAMMLDPSAPLYVRPTLDPAVIRWMLAFRRACRPAWFEHSMRVLAALGHHAIDAFTAIVDGAAITCGYQPLGWHDVYRTERSRDRAAREAELLRAHGYAVAIKDGDQLRRDEPVYRDDVLGAAHWTESAFADPRAFILGLAAALRARGVEIREGARVTEFMTSGDALSGVRMHDGSSIHTTCAVLAAGAWSPRLARTVGCTVPMQPGKGYHVTIPNPGLRVAAVMSETYVACTPIGDRLQLAGTVELAGLRRTINRRRLNLLPVGAERYLRDIELSATDDEWSGFRPCTGDGLPIVGPSALDGVTLATGHAMMGFCLGPITGRLVSAWICDGTPLPEALSARR